MPTKNCFLVLKSAFHSQINTKSTKHYLPHWWAHDGHTMGPGTRGDTMGPQFYQSKILNPIKS